MNAKNQKNYYKRNQRFGFAIMLILIVIVILYFQDNYFLKAALNEGDSLIKRTKIHLANIPPCNYKEVQELPYKSTLIIGHAYGKPGSKHEMLDPQLLKFLNQNEGKFSRIIFTGDVFKEPSSKKWRYLNELSKNLKIDYFVAPGNHDTQYNDTEKRSAFNKFFISSYPITIAEENNLFIIEDTTINPWKFQSRTLELIKNNADTSKNLFLFTHHISSSELSIFSNSSEFQPSNLMSIEAIDSLFGHLYKQIYIINGDTGAQDYLPSLSCISKKNTVNIANGIGGKVDDLILIINKEQILSMSIY
ncbi:metallophosphoesterase [Gammaproteobacteria bacterium]|nr:metallophosphoesterase [Gammaproteobacteria bacterium]